MVQIDDVIVSLDVFREKFVCNLDACKGECCIEGDMLEVMSGLEETLRYLGWKSENSLLGVFHTEL